MKNSRPVNLSLTTVSFPITAIASILHRASAVVVWVGLGVVLAFLGCALSSPQNFTATHTLLTTNCGVQFVAWALISAFGYYSAGGVKHIIQDMGYCEEFSTGKMISWMAIIVGLVISVWAGVAIWL